jgi:hypothetical protein
MVGEAGGGTVVCNAALHFVIVESQDVMQWQGWSVVPKFLVSEFSIWYSAVP